MSLLISVVKHTQMSYLIESKGMMLKYELGKSESMTSILNLIFSIF